MKFKLCLIAVGLLLPAFSWAQAALPSRPGAVSAPCVDLSRKPTNPAQTQGFFNRVGGVVGLRDGVDPTADQNVCPLSAQQKAAVWARRSYSPGNVVIAGLKAAVWQATDSGEPGGWGQGWEPYGQRFGASLAKSESGLFFQNFLFPVLLHEDPRYFREARGSAGHRLGYALTRVVVGRTDGGHHRFNFSQVMGAFAAAGLSNAYYPEPDRTVARTLSSTGISLATSAGWNILYEFGPEILRKLSGRKKTTD